MACNGKRFSVAASIAFAKLVLQNGLNEYDCRLGTSRSEDSGKR